MANGNTRVYLAGPFFSDAQVKRAKTVHAALTDNPLIGYIFEPMENQNEAIVSKYGNGSLEEAMKTVEWQKATFDSDVRQINQADVVVAILDFDTENGNVRPDEGTIWEIGYAHAMNKPVILVQFDEMTEEPLNLMLTMYTAYFAGESDIVAGLTNYDFISLPFIETNRPVF
jgi:nucleoside deoxyribosyltransferase